LPVPVFCDPVVGELHWKLHTGFLPMLRYPASEVRFNGHLAKLRQSRVHRILRDLYCFLEHCNLHERHHASVGEVLQRNGRYLQGVLQWQ
jgi:hypothetical protein